ncbi:MAG: hypothetical protein ACOYL6_07755 [Bacteriovoracaceae bacterium]
MSTPHIPSITLIGDMLENFYQLGVKDKDAYPEVKKFFRHLIGDTNLITTSALQTFHEFYFGKCLKHNPEFRSQVFAYAEGLGTDPKELSFELLIPELLGSPGRFAPNLQKFLMGCSSLFRYDQKTDSIYHGRILDLPMVKLWEKHERVVNYRLKNSSKIHSFGVAGNPYPSYSAMNEMGLSLAVHQKYSQFFNQEGHPIHYIAYKILSECDSVKSVMKLLKSFPSMTYWGLYLSTREGKVIALDVCGDRIDKEEFDIKNVPFLYFNNAPIKVDQHNQNVLPYSIPRLNSERNEVMQKRLKKFHKSTFKHDDMLNLLSEAEIRKSGEFPLQAPLTLSSVQILSMNPKLLTAGYLLGDTPRFQDGKRIEIHFKSHIVDSTELMTFASVEEKYKTGMRKLARSQFYFEQNELTECFHEIQLAQLYLKDFAEGVIADFYFGVFQYLSASKKGDFQATLDMMIGLEKKLPEYLDEHRKLFIMRLEKILTKKTFIMEDDFKDKTMQKYYSFEININGLGLKLLRKLIYPKVDLGDVLYLY